MPGIGGPLSRPPVSETSFPADPRAESLARSRSFNESEFKDEGDAADAWWNVASAGWALSLEGVWLAYIGWGGAVGFGPGLPVIVGVLFLIFGVLLGFTVSPRFTVGGYAAAGAGVFLGAYMYYAGEFGHAMALPIVPLLTIVAECTVGPALGVVGSVMAVRAAAREE
jgi:hypothetical protein